MRKIDLIVIHCSATRENTDYSPEQLESDHKARGFLSAGYNFYIRKSGEVVNLRPLEQIPAHARGHNKHSIGICYEGGLDITGQSRDTRTQAHPLCAASPFLSDVSLASPVPITAILIFRFVSVYTASW